MQRSLSRGVATLLAGVAMVGIVAGCGSSDEESSSTTAKQKGPIVVGAAIAKTGLFAAYDGDAYKAFRMAVDEINAKGGVDGRQIEIIDGDTASEVAKGPQVAQKLIDDGAKILMVTCDFDNGSPAASVAQSKGLVSMSLCAMSPKFGVQGIGEFAYTANQAATQEGAILAQWGAQEKNLKKAFVLLDDTVSYDKDLCNGFEQRYGPSGGTVAGKATFKNGDRSIASQITKIKSSAADSVMLCSYPPGGATAVRQLRAAGVDLPILSGLGMDGTYWLKAVPDLSDMFVSTPVSVLGDDPNPDVNAFTKAFADKNGGVAPATGLGAVGYADAQVLAEGIRKAGTTDAAQLSKALNGLNGFPTLIGPVSFTDQQHIGTGRPMAILEYVDGKPKYVATIKPEGEVDLGL